MRVGRSLSPGKVFIEMNGVLRKVEPDQINPYSALKKSEYRRTAGGTLVQWGISDSVIVVDDIVFPVSFQDVPNITTTSSDGAAVESRNISTTGFQPRTQAASVNWVAIGR